MGRIITSVIFVLLLISTASAEIIINKQPSEIYNLGDSFSIPVTIKSSNDISGIFQMDLICEGHDVNFYKNGVGLAAGEEKKMEPSLVLIKSLIGELKGECKIKGILGEEYILTNNFKISDLITIQVPTENIEGVEFKPGENILIEGGAIKENKKDVDGFIELEIISDNESQISQLETINKGFFSINISLPEDMKAGTYLVKLNAYEKDLLEETTNKGFINYNILISQVPTNLEIAFENPEVEPGTPLKVKAILHDQTGEKIASSAIMTIKNENNKILEQIEKPTDEFLDFPIKYNEAPSEWIVVAVSNKLMSETTFKIKEKKDIRVEIINRTLILTNIGNVPYNDIFLVKIGNESLNINVSLDVDKSQKYILSAPDGEYQVEIITEEGSKITESVSLTGKAIDVKEASNRVVTLVKYPIVWIFIIAIFGFVAFIIFKKGYKKSFFGYINSKKRKGEKAIPLRKNSLVNAKNKAELSLSIKGDKQNVTVVCLKIKNLKEIESKKSSTEETLQKIVDMVEENKAVIYENQDNLFFILAPVKTRTFKNEKVAVDLAEKIKEIIIGHNKLAKQKIEFGISLNYGTIVAKQEKECLKFMSMGTLITTAKKISSLSEKEILLSEKIKERLMSDVKTEKHIKEKVPFYTIKEIRNKEEHKKFIKSFLDRIEKK